MNTNGKSIFKKVGKKFYIILLLIIALIITVICLLFGANRGKKENKIDKSKIQTKTRVVEVTESKFSKNIDISGFLEPYDIQNVQFRGTGAITGVYVKEGDEVKKGDLLATIDDTNQRYNYVKTQQELEKAKLIGNQKEIELLEMQLKIAENNLAYTRAVANFDGVVVEVNIAEGDYAEAGTTLNLIKLVDINPLEATVEIDEIDMSIIREGMQIELDFDSLPGVKVPAIISYIPTLGTYNSTTGIGGKKVKISVNDPPEGIYPGYSFSSTIRANSQTTYILIPNSAVKSTRGRTYVIKKEDDGSEKQVDVTVRYLGEGVSQLLTGDIKVGDKLVGNSNASLSEKMSNFSSPPAGAPR